MNYKFYSRHIPRINPIATDTTNKKDLPITNDIIDNSSFG